MLISIKISRNSAFLGSDKPKMLFFPLINVKMPTIVGILTFMSRKIFILSSVEHEKSFITSGPGYRPYVRYIVLQRNLARRVITSSTGARLAGICST